MLGRDVVPLRLEDPFRTARLERNRDRDSTATALKKGLITAAE